MPFSVERPVRPQPGVPDAHVAQVAERVEPVPARPHGCAPRARPAAGPRRPALLRGRILDLLAGRQLLPERPGDRTRCWRPSCSPCRAPGVHVDSARSRTSSVRCRPSSWRRISTCWSPRRSTGGASTSRSLPRRWSIPRGWWECSRCRCWWRMASPGTAARSSRWSPSGPSCRWRSIPAVIGAAVTLLLVNIFPARRARDVLGLLTRGRGRRGVRPGPPGTARATGPPGRIPEPGRLHRRAAHAVASAAAERVGQRDDHELADAHRRSAADRPAVDHRPAPSS